MQRALQAACPDPGQHGDKCFRAPFRNRGEPASHCRIRSPCCVRRLSRGTISSRIAGLPPVPISTPPACFLHMPRMLCSGIPLWCSDVPRLRQTLGARSRPIGTIRQPALSAAPALPAACSAVGEHQRLKPALDSLMCGSARAGSLAAQQRNREAMARCRLEG